MSTDLIPLSLEQYPALVGGIDVLEMIQANMGGEQVTPSDLNRIKVPAGGGAIWTVVDADGQEQASKTLEGIIVHIARRRAYWGSAEPSGEPPQCYSIDCINGVGNPAGECAKCPNNIFGSAVKQDGSTGRGKACKETKLVFLLRAGMQLPDVVAVPGASLKAMRKYQLALGAPYWAVLTRLELVRTKNRDSIEYAQIAPKKIGVLEPDVAKRILTYAQALQAVFAAVTIDHDDLGGGDTAEV